MAVKPAYPPAEALVRAQVKRASKAVSPAFLATIPNVKETAK